MAESKNNIVIHGFSGKLGDILVFRQLAGKTIATKAPGSPTREPSPAQQAIREKFQRAIIYSKAALSDPLTRQLYVDAAKEGQHAFNVSVADFFHAPDIHSIDLDGYSGQVGEKIRITVTDNFKVKWVRLTIQNVDGTIVEEGEALQEQDGPTWTYTITANNPNRVGDKISITASDLPANLTTEEKDL